MKQLIAHIENIIELALLGKCPDCHSKPLNHFCVTCQFCNGISRKEAVENNWGIDKVLEVSKSRKAN